MNRLYFISGTDTGVGKTMISAALLRGFIDARRRVRYFKPVQTGCQLPDADDTRWVQRAAGAPDDALISPIHRLPLPAAPELAARHAGIRIAFDDVVNAIHRFAAQTDILLVEGAGGLLVPIDDSHTMLDLMHAVRATPVIVARTSLGTLNHAALTLRELERAGLSAGLVVANESTPPEPGDPVPGDNVRKIASMASPAAFYHLAYVAKATPSFLADTGRSMIQLLPQATYPSSSEKTTEDLQMPRLADSINATHSAATESPAR